MFMTIKNKKMGRRSTALVSVSAILCLSLASLGAEAASIVIEEWVARYDGPANGSDSAVYRGIAVDTSGNVYVTGSSRGIGFTLAKGLGNAGSTIILNGTNEDRLTESVKIVNLDSVLEIGNESNRAPIAANAKKL